MSRHSQAELPSDKLFVVRELRFIHDFDRKRKRFGHLIQKPSAGDKPLTSRAPGNTPMMIGRFEESMKAVFSDSRLTGALFGKS